MDAARIRETMHVQVSRALRELALDEIAAQREAVLQNSDPRPRYGYGRVAHLYTEGEGTQMHEEVRAAFLAVSANILGVSR